MSGSDGEGIARLILYVGKGGVGKTTVAAATAVLCAELGHRTLVVSTDLAHSLGDALAIPLGADPYPVADRLWAQEINVLEQARRSWGKLQSQIADVLQRQGVPTVQAEELAVVPGMQEVAALVQIESTSRTGEYDCIIVDAAPTGETIRLLTMPESFQWYARRLQSLRTRLNRLARPLLRRALPDLNVIDLFDELSRRVHDLRLLLTDPEHSSYRIVVTPDRTVLKEAQRAETYLNLFGYPMDAVILNRMMRAAVTGDDYIDRLLARQQQATAEIRAAFAALPVFEAPLTAEEPVGGQALAALASSIFGQRDPADVMHVGPTQRIERTEDGYKLQIPMPNVEIEKLTLTRRGDELHVDVGNFRREIPLPSALAVLVPKQARITRGVLEIAFVQPTESGKTT